MRHGFHDGGGGGGGRHLALSRQFEVKQAVGVVEGRAKDLAARQILERGRDAAGDGHVGSFNRVGGTQTRQGGAIGADQENSLDQIATRLFDGKGGKVGVVQRAFGHHAIDGQC